MTCATKNDLPRWQNVFENQTSDADVTHKRIKTNETNIMLVANHLMRTLRSTGSFSGKTHKIMRRFVRQQ